MCLCRCPYCYNEETNNTSISSFFFFLQQKEYFFASLLLQYGRTARRPSIPSPVPQGIRWSNIFYSLCRHEASVNIPPARVPVERRQSRDQLVWVGDNRNMDTKPFLDFVTDHKNIVTTVIMRWGSFRA